MCFLFATNLKILVSLNSVVKKKRLGMSLTGLLSEILAVALRENRQLEKFHLQGPTSQESVRFSGFADYN